MTTNRQLAKYKALTKLSNLTPADEGIQAARNDAMVIYKAEFITDNFHFEALGDSANAAQQALLNGLTRHGREYRCRPLWWEEVIEEGHDVFRITPFILNAPALRDREPIKG